MRRGEAKEMVKWPRRKLGSNYGHCIVHFQQVRDFPLENVQPFPCAGLFELWRYTDTCCDLSFCHYGNTSLLVLSVATLAIPPLHPGWC